jgi:hypothetical protein
VIDNNSSEPDPSQDLIARFDKWDKLLDAHWSEWADEAKLCYDFVAGAQHDDGDKAMLEELGRVAVTFNRIGPMIDAVSGAEIMGRQQVVYEPRQVGATAQNEVLSKGAEWVRDECDAEHEESECAKDALICGVGVTETRMDYDEHPDGQIVIERVDPLEVRFDASSRKANFADARYNRWRKAMSLEQFNEQWPEASPDAPGSGRMADPVVVDPNHRYKDGSDALGEDEVYVTRWQWFDMIEVHRLGDPTTGETTELEDPQDPQSIHAQVAHHNAERAKLGHQPIQHLVQKKRRYRQAWVASGRVLEGTDIAAEGFTLKAMTGKRDRNKGTWYGLVKPMLDPQRFSNKFFEQALNILNSNAKGGLLAEEDAFEDIRAAEDSWADASAITVVRTGALGQFPKIKNKEPPQFPPAIEKLMQISVTAIRDTTGVNQELLGLSDRDQPGVLEHQRKQAAYGILSAFFDSIKRYRKIQGRLLLKFMQLYLPADYLVRIINDQGSPEYQAIGTAFNEDNIRFSVIVDDAPAGPNEKAQTFQVLQAMVPLLQQANLPASVWAEIVRYSPLPAAVSQKIASALVDGEKRQAAQAQDPLVRAQQALHLQAGAAEVADKQASAEHHSAQANVLNAKAGVEAKAAIAPAGTSPKDRLDLARAADMEAKAVATAQQINRPQGPEIY